ncbi:chemotaxis protein CheD [Porticoccaceae bacterium LTM1]|nr:chemotaxis protein CheD [Porticoccaceae bacterium LTM1]
MMVIRPDSRSMQLSDTSCFLHPGDWLYSAEAMTLKTVLGSCVAVIIWHGKTQSGGMCHFVLPEVPTGSMQHRPAGYYGDSAVKLLITETKKLNAHPGEFRVGVYGAICRSGDESGALSRNIGKRNVEMAKKLLAQNGFVIAEKIVSEPVGYLSVSLNLRDGHVDVKSGPLTDSNQNENYTPIGDIGVKSCRPFAS